MAKSDEVLRLSFKGAPLILALAAQDAALKIQIGWPKTLVLSELTKSLRLSQSEQDQLGWIKRSFDQMQKSQHYRQYGPHILPLLAKVDIRLQVDPRNIARLAHRLSGLPLTYTKTVAESFAKQLKFSLPRLASDNLVGSLINDRSLLRVISASPVNELELGLTELYNQSGLSWTNSQAAWLEQSYDQKLKLLKRSIGSSQTPSYLLEVVTEPGRLLALSRSGHFDVRSIQPAVVAHGYELPPDLPDGGMMERCFDISSELYAHAQAKQQIKSQLFVLWGHRQRALIGVEHEQIKQVALSKNSFVSAMRGKLAERHPQFWEEWGKLG